MQIQSLIEDYLEFLQYEKQGSAATAYLRYYELHHFRKYLEQEQGIDSLQEIKIHHLRSYISHLHGAGYQPVSLGNTISTLRALYSYALNKGLVTTNLAQRIKKPRIEKKEMEHFTWEEVEVLFQAVPEGPNYWRDLSILLLLYYCGLRLEELRNIRKSDFSEDLTELYVEKGKGDKSRLLPVHPFLQRVLRHYLNSTATGAGQHLPTPASSFFFPGKWDQPLAKSRIYSIVKQCGKLAGLNKRVSPHVFRHSFATHLHQKGVDMNCLAQLLGHANIEKTAIYTHTDDDALTEAVLKLKEKGNVYGKKPTRVKVFRRRERQTGLKRGQKGAVQNGGRSSLRKR